MSAFVADGVSTGLRQLHEVHASTAIWAGSLALFMAATGALDTEAANWPERIGYWTVAVGMGLAATLVSGRWRLGFHNSKLSTVATRVALLLLPISTAALWTCIAMFGGEWSVERLAALVPTIAAMLVVLQMPLVYLAPPVSAKPAHRPDLCRTEVRADTCSAATAASPLDQLLPSDLLGADLYALEAQDHYVRVHTSRGRAMLRMRLTDAVAAAAPVAGLQTHRSWWIARSAVQRLARRGSGQIVILKNGETVPVSRSLQRVCRDLI